ncbi:MAG: ATP-binding protein [Lachnospiraceae bacterium]|nr:ATP-binding protein [Lachnospiraceae bacterium]
MALSNAQYDEIMRGYQTRQLQNQHKTKDRLEKAYKQEPELKEIDETIASVSVASARKMLDGDTNAFRELKKQLQELRQKKSILIQKMGFPKDYFLPIYTCSNCKDTGFIDGQKCHCFQQEIINLVYSQSNIKNILNKENFSTFSYKYYSNTEINPSTGLSALQTAKRAVGECCRFIEDFDNKPKNLFFYGNTGVGKTFLSNCVANALLEKGKSVIYFTAFQLFDILSKGVFQKDIDAIEAHQNIFYCDLLIIDDLGTEFANSFTTSQLFLCVNERILRQKSTIISTNLSMKEITELYSERTVSRITSDYTIIKLFGDDIRFIKRQMH